MERWAHWIAFALLAFIGLRMIKESFAAEEAKDRCDPTKA